MGKSKFLRLQILIHVAALLPLAILVWQFTQGQLTVNPIQEIQLRTGKYALILLVLSLACTPTSIVFGFKKILGLRRPLGLYAFMYTSLHFLNFIGLDYGFNFGLLREDIFQKRYALVGFAAFLSLLPLAITSTKGWVERLDKNWRHLHRLIYLAGVLAVTHFVLQAKADLREPLLYGAVVAFLLVVRISIVGKTISEFRSKLERPI